MGIPGMNAGLICALRASAEKLALALQAPPKNCPDLWMLKVILGKGSGFRDQLHSVICCPCCTALSF